MKDSEKRRQFQWPWRRREDIHADVDEEITFHLDMRTEELVRSGMDRAAARAQADREFGDIEKARRFLRQADERSERGRRRAEVTSGIRQDFKYAVRSLRQSPSFAIAAILTMALGIGATTIIFTAVDGVLLRPLPFPQSDRLAAVQTSTSQGLSTLSPSDFVDLRREASSFEEMAAYHPNALVLGDGEFPEQITAARVTPGFFEILRIPPAAGRTIVESDAVARQDRFIVLSDALWRRRFAADREIVGRSIRIDGEAWQVIGIMPPGFAFPRNADAWAPRSFTERDLTTQRGAHYLRGIGRLKPEATIEGALAQLKTIGDRLARDYPNTNTGSSATAVELKEFLVGSYRKPLYVLFGAVGCLLLIACANVAGLSLVRTVDRSHELALRAALGAGRGRIVRTLLTESIVIGLIAGTLGILLSIWAVQFLVTLGSQQIPRLADAIVDFRIIAFSLAISIASSLLFGILPLLRISPAANLAGWLAEGRRTMAGGKSGARLRAGLVAGELALALVLLAGAGLLGRSFLNLQRSDPGFSADNVLTFRLALPRARYPEPQKAGLFFADLHNRIAQLPGVIAAGSVSGLPFSGQEYIISVESVDGRKAYEKPDDAKSVQVRVATPGYFRAMGLQLIRGRGFEETDGEGAPKVVVISEATARLLWPNIDPIGRSIEIGTGLGLGRGRVGGTIVGIIKDINEFGFRDPAPPMLFTLHAQFPVPNMAVTVRANANPEPLLTPIRAQVRELDPELAIATVITMPQLIGSSFARDVTNSVLIGVFAFLGLAIAAIGIYGVTAYSVGLRTREFGVRITLGASGRQIVGSVLKRSLLISSAGIVAGLACTLAATQLLETLVFGLSTDDPFTIAAGTAVLAVVAVIASWLPARRASRVDPMVALREE